MNDFSYLNKVKEDLKKIDKFWVVIYGSALSEYYTPPRSDIDVVIITQLIDKEENMNFWTEITGQLSEKYDIKIFELLPLFIKIEVIKNYKVIFGNPLEISEYFYYYRSIWKDMTYRIKANKFKSIKEKIEILERKQI